MKKLHVEKRGDINDLEMGAIEETARAFLGILRITTLMMPTYMKRSINMSIATSILANELAGKDEKECQKLMLDVCANVRKGVDIINKDNQEGDGE